MWGPLTADSPGARRPRFFTPRTTPIITGMAARAHGLYINLCILFLTICAAQIPPFALCKLLETSPFDDRDLDLSDLACYKGVYRPVGKFSRPDEVLEGGYYIYLFTCRRAI